MTRARLVTWVPAGIAIVILAILPLLSSNFFTSTIGVRSLWLGIAAASLIFLSGYGGMVSLAQAALYGIAGFAMGNLVAADGGALHNHLFGIGLGDNWNAWWGAIGGILIATMVGLGFGAIASRSYGIYFLMLTLALGVLAYYFFGQVEQLSGFGGINSVRPPHVLGDPVTRPDPLYYTALIASAFVYLLMRYLGRGDIAVGGSQREGVVGGGVAGETFGQARLSTARARHEDRRHERSHRDDDSKPSRVVYCKVHGILLGRADQKFAAVWGPYVPGAPTMISSSGRRAGAAAVVEIAVVAVVEQVLTRSVGAVKMTSRLSPGPISTCGGQVVRRCRPAPSTLASLATT